MKQLYILRHTQAAGTPVGGTDKERPLTEQGLGDARALGGGAMMRAEFAPDLVLCSTAVRTQQTLTAVLEKVDDAPHIEYLDALYNASQGDCLAAIQGVAANVDALLLVGHNPGIHALAANLANEDNPSMVSRLSTGYAPGTLTAFGCGITDWGDLRPYENRILGILESIEYNGADRPTRWM